jgi:hypothetical protein
VKPGLSLRCAPAPPDILCRNSVNFIVPYIVEAQGFSEAQGAALLAGFFPVRKNESCTRHSTVLS